MVVLSQAYHSSFNPEKDDTGKEVGGRCIANMALLPVKTNFRGPAPKASKCIALLLYDFNYLGHLCCNHTSWLTCSFKLVS